MISKTFETNLFRHKFHYFNENNLTFLCMSQDFSEEIPFAFLSDVRRKFIQTYDLDKLEGFYAYQLNDFSEVLKQLMVYLFCLTFLYSIIIITNQNLPNLERLSKN
jgi:hypothetical protein